MSGVQNLNLYSIIAGVAFLLLTFLAWYGQNEFENFPVWGYVVALLAALTLGYGLWESRRQLKSGMGRKSTRTGFQVAGMVIIVVAIMVVVELVSVKHYTRWDLTPGGFFSLSSKTTQILDKLEKEKRRIEIIAFVRKLERSQVKKIFEQYTHRTKMVTFRFLDLDAAPRTAKKYDVDAYGTIVVIHHFDTPQAGDKDKEEPKSASSGEKAPEAKAPKKNFRSEKIYSLSENAMVNAILKTIQTKQKVVYFLTGHGERLFAGRGRGVMGAMAVGMRDDNYKVEELLLLRKKGVPEDTNLLIIAGPKNDIEEAEAGFIEDYLKRGGRLLTFLEPDFPDGRLTGLLGKFGFQTPKSFVIDPQAVRYSLVGGNELTPFVTDYGIHEITKQLRGLATVFPTARRVDAKSDLKKGFSAETLLKTGPGSYTVSKIDVKDNQVVIDTATKKDGPVPLGAAVTISAKKKDGTKDEGKEARIVVYGDVDFASDAFIRAQGNANLVFNSVNWLSGEKALVSIRPKNRTGDPLILAGGQGNFVRLVTVWLMPIFIVLFGVAIYVRRRQLQ